MADKLFMDDYDSLKALVKRLPEDVQDVYNGYGSLAVEAAHLDKRLVVYTLRGSKPSDIEVMRFGSLMCNGMTGPWAEIHYAGACSRLEMVPSQLGNRELFLHVPQNFLLKYRGRMLGDSGVDFVSHYAVLIKTRSREFQQVEGHTYCVTLKKFHDRFPDNKFRY